ncbi:hypothetical protein, partial [Thermus scotoductus]|uniref:hypothetical protein n=1 Tax=Thermus scotoductus TaxID=37636 RepID=UPI001C12CABF
MPPPSPTLLYPSAAADEEVSENPVVRRTIKKKQDKIKNWTQKTKHYNHRTLTQDQKNQQPP